MISEEVMKMKSEEEKYSNEIFYKSYKTTMAMTLEMLWSSFKSAKTLDDLIHIKSKLDMHFEIVCLMNSRVGHEERKLNG